MMRMQDYKILLLTLVTGSGQFFLMNLIALSTYLSKSLVRVGTVVFGLKILIGSCSVYIHESISGWLPIEPGSM